ncbi:MAG TPA: HAD family hydrolase [Chthoniobacterales bacterium]
MSLKAILFDLDDTLVVDEAVSKQTFAAIGQLAARHGAEGDRLQRVAQSTARKLWGEGSCHAYCRSIGISAFECLWGKFEGATPELTALREWSHAFRVEAFDRALREQLIDNPVLAQELAAAWSSTRRKNQRLMPDAVETLARLSAYRIGLLTNGAPDLQREKLAASGLGSFFQAVAVSGEHGIGKPKPEIFQRLLAELGVEAGEAVMVGNSLERDIAGANAAGITSIWLKVAGSEEHFETTPRFTLHGLAELPKILAGLEA